MSTEHPSQTCLLLILPPLFWAGNSVLARGIADQIPPVTLAFWRWALALIILLPFTWRQLCQDWPEIKRGWKQIAVLGLLGIASFNTLLYTAAHTTTALNIALTQALMPVVIVLMSYVLFGDGIHRRQAVAITLCLLGAGYVVIQGNPQRLMSMQYVTGDLLMLLAVCLYALYSVLLRTRPAVHPMSFLTSTFTVGVVLLLPLYLWETQTTAGWVLSSSVVTSLLYVALFPSILAYLCWNRGIHEIGANRAGLYINLIPLFAALLAILLLGEHFQSYHLVAGSLIVSGLLLFNLPVAKKSRELAP
ncbi:MAG: DMT family transporter [Desulfuromonadaceae bacterium]|nr:DMT family transporter [Desulfuromonadaceae bacterium]